MPWGGAFHQLGLRCGPVVIVVCADLYQLWYLLKSYFGARKKREGGARRAFSPGPRFPILARIANPPEGHWEVVIAKVENSLTAWVLFHLWVSGGWLLR